MDWDSAEEVYDASDAESLDDQYSDNRSTDEDEEDDCDYNDSTSQEPQQQSYTILSELDIYCRQIEDITKTSTVLSISRASSSILLCHYNWSVSKVQDEWFADEEKVRKAVGLFEKPAVKIPENIEELLCGICFEIYPLERMAAAVCGHLFCVVCWASYISTSINESPRCLMLRCPDPSCGAAIDQAFINQFASGEDKEKYSRCLRRSYVEGNRNIKWCPAPGCGYAVEFVVGTSESYDVTCGCSYSFCWSCAEETHRPVDCNTVAKWILKHSREDEENLNWILAYTKSCPKCKRPIEKNNGCMHMTCRAPCLFEFCWLCLAGWSGHRDCNRYAGNNENGEGINDEDEDEDGRRRKIAKIAVQKYNHYYERWTSNQSSREKALALHKTQTAKLDNLGAKQGVSMSELEFITEAWLQIVECRRVLQWTYAYGYYLTEDEHAKKQLFEFLQGEAEAGLERLHSCVEKELPVFLEAEVPIPTFKEFRIKVIGFTSVTRTYFENLVEAFENGLSEVVAKEKNSEKKGKGVRKAQTGMGFIGTESSGSYFKLALDTCSACRW